MRTTFSRHASYTLESSKDYVGCNAHGLQQRLNRHVRCGMIGEAGVI